MTQPAEVEKSPVVASPAPKVAEEKPISVFRRRWRKFKTLKRGWYSFCILLAAIVLSLFNPLLINDVALVVHYDGHTYFPALSTGVYQGSEFGQHTIGEARYRDLKETFAKEGKGNWVILAPYPYSPNESLLRDPTLEGSPPHAPSRTHWMGTDDRARDVFARLVYGFRISMLFGLCVTALEYATGVAIGAALGYFGGRADIVGSRLVEIWSSIPFLYTVIILSSIIQPNLPELVGLLAIFQWMAIFYYVRGEFYREKSKDYVAAAIATGESHASIIFRYILPNALTPIISFAPFSLVGSILALVSLDFLGFGVPAPTPSWGELVHQGHDNIFQWHLVLFPLGALFLTLMLVVFIGEAVREAFDPKVWSRLR